ncbi:MAG: nickel pincer cofactor biosynthesis protein LarC [Cyanobacteriota bacterium ELA615]
MSQIAYLECKTGISGDMCLGALVDLGVPLQYLQAQLSSLSLDHEYRLWSEPVSRGQQIVTKVHVDLLEDAHHHHRHLPQIENLILQGGFSPRVKQWSLEIFRQLAIAEGAVHGISPEMVAFHEVGATDALVDIVGTCLGFDWLNIDEIHSSALPTGGGLVKASHGILTVPTPAVLKLWQSRSVPVYSNGIEKELVTPTGAAIVVTLAKGFGPIPAMSVQKVGLGAGTRDLEIPNVLRLWLGEIEQTTSRDTVTLLETQIDDLNPQAIGYLYPLLLQAGALDVFTSAIVMKKSRPGLLLSVVCPSEKLKDCQKIIFRETTTLGIRYSQQQRSILERESLTVETIYGPVQIKIGRHLGSIVNLQPEYEDCAQIAQKVDKPWRYIHQLALLEANKLGIWENF